MATAEVRVEVVARAPLAGLQEEAVERVVAAAWTLYGGRAGATVEVVLLGGAEHTRQHARLLEDPTATDVMAIPYDDPDLAGEVLVNVDVARAEAAARGVTPAREALLYVAHGVLHLLGFDDHDSEERARMRAAEAAVLGRALDESA